MGDFVVGILVVEYLAMSARSSLPVASKTDVFIDRHKPLLQRELGSVPGTESRPEMPYQPNWLSFLSGEVKQ